MTVVVARKPPFQRVELSTGFEITDRDITIIKMVTARHFIRSSDIISLLGGSPQKILRRLDQLYHRGFLQRPGAQVEWYRAGSGSRPLVYSLGNHRIDLLVERYGYRRSAVDWTAKARTVKRRNRPCPRHYRGAGGDRTRLPAARRAGGSVS